MNISHIRLYITIVPQLLLRICFCSMGNCISDLLGPPVCSTCSTALHCAKCHPAASLPSPAPSSASIEIGTVAVQVGDAGGNGSQCAHAQIDVLKAAKELSIAASTAAAAPFDAKDFERRCAGVDTRAIDLTALQSLIRAEVGAMARLTSTDQRHAERIHMALKHRQARLWSQLAEALFERAAASSSTNPKTIGGAACHNLLANLEAEAEGSVRREIDTLLRALASGCEPVTLPEYDASEGEAEAEEADQEGGAAQPVKAALTVEEKNAGAHTGRGWELPASAKPAASKPAPAAATATASASKAAPPKATTAAPSAAATKNKRTPWIEPKEEFHFCYFFPDPALPCNAFMQNRPCTRGNCTFAHSDTSFTRFLSILDSARVSLDVCVFTITNDSITQSLIAAKKRGVKVRLITDDDCADGQGSDIRELQQNGIDVRLDASPAHMHNKFVVIDSRLVITGSFNWTVQAVTGNRENIVVTNNVQMRDAFASEFANLWAVFQKNLLS